MTNNNFKLKIFFISIFALCISIVANSQCCNENNCLEIECGNLYWQDAAENGGNGLGIQDVSSLQAPITFIDSISANLPEGDTLQSIIITIYDGLVNTTDSITEIGGSLVVDDFTNDVMLSNDIVIEYQIVTNNCEMGKTCSFAINHVVDPCMDVECEAPLICDDGECIEPPDLCEGVICAENEICEDGECIPQEAILELLKLATTEATTEAGTPAYQDGVQILYTLIVCNTGDLTTTNVTVFDDMPAFVTYLSDDGEYDGATGIWTVGDLEVGECDTLNIKVIPDSPDLLVDITNTATANSDQTEEVTAENILAEKPCTNCHGVRTFENSTTNTTGNPANFTGEAPPVAGGFNDGENASNAWLIALGGQGWALRNGRIYEITYIIYCGDTCYLDTPVQFNGERGGFTKDLVSSLNSITGENWNFGFHPVLGPGQNFDPNGFGAYNYFETNCDCGLDGFGFNQVNFPDRKIDVIAKLQTIQLCEESPGPATPPEICTVECDCSTFELINHSEGNEPVNEPSLICGNEYHLIPPECSGEVTSYLITNGSTTFDGVIANGIGILTIPNTVESGSYSLNFNIEGCGDYSYKISVKCEASEGGDLNWAVNTTESTSTFTWIGEEGGCIGADSPTGQTIWIVFCQDGEEVSSMNTNEGFYNPCPSFTLSTETTPASDTYNQIKFVTR